jgi:hypothetical protein
MFAVGTDGVDGESACACEVDSPPEMNRGVFLGRILAGEGVHKSRGRGASCSASKVGALNQVLGVFDTNVQGTGVQARRGLLFTAPLTELMWGAGSRSAFSVRFCDFYKDKTKDGVPIRWYPPGPMRAVGRSHRYDRFEGALRSPVRLGTTIGAQATLVVLA